MRVCWYAHVYFPLSAAAADCFWRSGAGTIVLYVPCFVAINAPPPSPAITTSYNKWRSGWTKILKAYYFHRCLCDISLCPPPWLAFGGLGRPRKKNKRCFSSHEFEAVPLPKRVVFSYHRPVTPHSILHFITQTFQKLILSSVKFASKVKFVKSVKFVSLSRKKAKK